MGQPRRGRPTEPPTPEGRPGPAAILFVRSAHRHPRPGRAGLAAAAGPERLGGARRAPGRWRGEEEEEGRRRRLRRRWRGCLAGAAGQGRRSPRRARGRSRGAEPGVLQALGGCGAAVGRVLQRGEEEAGEGSNLVFCPVVSLRQDAVETAGGQSGDPQKSTWQRQRKHSTSVTACKTVRLPLLASYKSSKAS